MHQGTRLQKVLAERGVASRRGSAELVLAGHVKVNSEVVVEPGLRVVPGDDCIEVDGVVLPREAETTRTILLHKPRGYICSRPTGQGKTVYDLLGGISERVVPAGRLDKDSEGLLLLSNDGDLIDRLTHPRFGREKVYRVTVSGEVTPEVLEELRGSIEIEGYETMPAEVKVVKGESGARNAEEGEKSTTDCTDGTDREREGTLFTAKERRERKERGDERTPASSRCVELRRDTGKTVLEFVLREGRNRQVRRLCERSGLRVHRLMRTRMGALTLAGLKPGQWRDVRESV